MNLHRFFTNQTWWGKLIGAFFGFLMGGPIGAFFGLLVGNFFDRGLTQHFSRPFWYYQAEKDKYIRQLFLQTLFSCLGHIAKADGRVTQTEIAFAEQLMDDMSLNPHDKKSAQSYFNNGKQASFNLIQTLTTFQRHTSQRPQLIRLFISTLYRAIKLNGFSQKKLAILETIFSKMGFASLNQQYQFFHDFGFRNQSSYSSHSSQNAPPPRYQTQSQLAQAYAILNVTPNASKQEIQRAYRKLISQHHPDKLIAKGASEEQIKEANERTQQIRKAYELISDSKG